jgi:hypothetical protein
MDQVYGAARNLACVDEWGKGVTVVTVLVIGELLQLWQQFQRGFSILYLQGMSELRNETSIHIKNLDTAERIRENLPC